MVVKMLLFLLENCLIDVNVDYSEVWSHVPELAGNDKTNVFAQLRLLRRRLSKKRYCQLVERVSEVVANVEKVAATRSRLNFDPFRTLSEVRKRGVMVYAFSMFGEDTVRELLEKHGLTGIFEGFVSRVRVDQPIGFLFPLRLAKRQIKDKQGDILFVCGDSTTIRSVKEANVPGIKIAALPLKPAEVRNIIMARPDYFLTNLSEIVDIFDLGLA